MLRRGVVDVLGGSRRPAIPVYANINRRANTRTPDGFASSARHALDAGFPAIKLAPFDGVDVAHTPEANRKGVAKGLECVAIRLDAFLPWCLACRSTARCSKRMLPNPPGCGDAHDARNALCRGRA